jgi:hypothetical protein
MTHPTLSKYSLKHNELNPNALRSSRKIRSQP